MSTPDVTAKIGEEDAIVRLSWRNSYWFVILVAMAIGLLTIATSLGLDWAIHGDFRRIYASDLLESIAASLLSGIALVRLQQRRRELLVRLQIIEDVNHHIRNALTGVTLSASLNEDIDLNGRIRDACDRIDWVLSDVLPQTIGANGSGATDQRWRPGRQLQRSKGKSHPR
ncbi:MAG TPA: hypothetical protein VGU46_08145 [Acidobacteriaceae bacterium]|nr:hypothetical protein [Acidobacteriaceae bacterium]